MLLFHLLSPSYPLSLNGTSFLNLPTPPYSVPHKLPPRKLVSGIFLVTALLILLGCHSFSHLSLCLFYLEDQLSRLGIAFYHESEHCLALLLAGPSPLSEYMWQIQGELILSRVMFWGWGSCFSNTGTWDQCVTPRKSWPPTAGTRMQGSRKWELSACWKRHHQLSQDFQKWLITWQTSAFRSLRQLFNFPEGRCLPLPK